MNPSLRVVVLGRNSITDCLMAKPLMPTMVRLTKPYLDLTKKSKARNLLKQLCPDIIINGVGEDSVVAAEKEKSTSLSLNFGAAMNLQDIATDCGACVIHFCSAHVYSGDKGSPYVETDVACPRTVLGDTKLKGTQALQASGDNYILRTANVWSRAGHGNDIFKSARTQLLTGKPVVVDNSQTTSFTYADTVAEVVRMIIANYRDDTICRGLYHVADSGQATEYQFVKHVASQLNYPSKIVVPGKQCEDIPRVKDNSLCCDKAKKVFGDIFFRWQTNLDAFM